MKRVIALFPTILLLLACSESLDGTDDPDLSPVVLNTGRLLSIDGSGMHIAYTYDEMGRIIYAERFDTAWNVVKMIGQYTYDTDLIYITFQEFAEKPNGDRDPDYSLDHVHYDTLFLENDRVDSVAGARQDGRNCFFYKFRYNERGELTYVRDDNVKRDRQGKLADKPWYTEIILLDWQDGNVLRKSQINSRRPDTTAATYTYSSLTGNVILSEPRNVLPDFEPLMQTGYFGKGCRNLFNGCETKATKEHIEYQLDGQGMVCQMKSNVIWNDGINHDYTFAIKWVDGQ